VLKLKILRVTIRNNLRDIDAPRTEGIEAIKLHRDNLDAEDPAS